MVSYIQDLYFGINVNTTSQVIEGLRYEIKWTAIDIDRRLWSVAHNLSTTLRLCEHI